MGKELNKDKVIRDAQYRKGLSIAFFNATNAAIQLYTTIHSDGTTQEETREFIKETRDWFLDEYLNHYAEVIGRVGVNYNPEVTIERLKKAKNVDELRTVWLALTQDERQDAHIISFTRELKKEYETIR